MRAKEPRAIRAAVSRRECPAFLHDLLIGSDRARSINRMSAPIPAPEPLTQSGELNDDGPRASIA